MACPQKKNYGLEGGVLTTVRMLVIRYLRTGKKNQPFFRIVVTDKRNPPTAGRATEFLGFYNPLTKEKKLKAERIKYWLSVGAQPSDTVYNLLVSEKIIEGKKIDVHKESKKEKEVAPAETAESKEETKEEPASTEVSAGKEEKPVEEKPAQEPKKEDVKPVEEKKTPASAKATAGEEKPKEEKPKEEDIKPVEEKKTPASAKATADKAEKKE